MASCYVDPPKRTGFEISDAFRSYERDDDDNDDDDDDDDDDECYSH